MIRRPPKPNPFPYTTLCRSHTVLDSREADGRGRDSDQGKPHPEIFLTAAEELGVPPAECFVVEDAANGVQAAKAGNMAAPRPPRGGDPELFGAAHAGLGVPSFGEGDRESTRLKSSHANISYC